MRHSHTNSWVIIDVSFSHIYQYVIFRKRMLSATHGWSCSGTLYSSPEKINKTICRKLIKKNIFFLCNNFRQCEILSLMKEKIHMVFLLNVIIICFNLVNVSVRVLFWLCLWVWVCDPLSLDLLNIFMYAKCVQ